MSRLATWVRKLGLFHSMSGGTCLIFDPPPLEPDAHGAAVVPALTTSQQSALGLRKRGWVVLATSQEIEAVRWLESLGYNDVTSKPTLRLPRAEQFGTSKLNLKTIAERILANPAVTSRVLAEELSSAEGRPIGRTAVNRAMIAIGWGARRREAFRSGVIEAPVIADE